MSPVPGADGKGTAGAELGAPSGFIEADEDEAARVRRRTSPMRGSWRGMAPVRMARSDRPETVGGKLAESWTSDETAAAKTNFLS